MRSKGLVAIRLSAAAHRFTGRYPNYPIAIARFGSNVYPNPRTE